jgi:hypothetical protein
MEQQRLELLHGRRIRRLPGLGDLAHGEQAPTVVREGEDGEEVVWFGEDGGFVAREGHCLDPHVGEDPFLLVAAPGETRAGELAHRAVRAVAAAQVPRPLPLAASVRVPENGGNPIRLPLDADEPDRSLDLAAERPQAVAQQSLGGALRDVKDERIVRVDTIEPELRDAAAALEERHAVQRGPALDKRLLERADRDARSSGGGG